MTAVWRGMTQTQLDAAYDQAAFAPNMQAVLARYAASSEAVRQRVASPKRLAYGPGNNERLDLYSPSADGLSPISIFIHGGAWRSGEAKNYAFPAELFLGAGAHFIPIDFDWVQNRNGNLLPIADQVRRAIAWVAKNAREFGGDPERIHLSGHSSGAHLAGVALTTNWMSEFDLPRDTVKSALLCSGIYDLEPVRLSARSSYVTFTDESEHILSAIRHLDRIAMPVTVAYGSNETPEFQRQSRELAQALRGRKCPVELLAGDALNHFEILETLAEPKRLLGGAALRLMELAG
jgi:arylformamidase